MSETDWQPAKPKPKPEDLDLESLFADAQWHQHWELFEGVFTPGRNPVSLLCDLIGLPRDLRGKRVLDIGAWNGCFSFECERRGATEVIAFAPDLPESTGFSKLKEAINANNVQYHIGSVYDLSVESLGEFDIILFLGVLYHLRHPLLAIDKLQPLARGDVYVETHILNDSNLGAGKNLASRILRRIAPGLPKEIPFWQFYKTNELAGDFSNWFSPNIRAVLDAFESAGFEINVVETWGDRASFHAKALEGGAKKALQGTYESMPVVKRSVEFKGSRDHVQG